MRKFSAKNLLKTGNLLMKNINVGLISLGCDKNRVDGEKLLAKVSESEKYSITSDINEADVLIINTCSFLNASRKEALDTVFENAGLKDGGRLKKIIMTGCLPQKFIDELYDALPEVDAFLGTYDGDKIIEAIDKALAGDRCNFVCCGKELGEKRVITTPDHYAYLKIADGCSNHCTYCLIPKIRGPFKSRPIEEIVSEAKTLGELQEVILVAQDTTKYGMDLYGEPKIIELIHELSELETIKYIRLLYCYPELLTDELISEIANNEKVIKYVDIPFQHASDRILKLMNRKGTYKSYLALVRKLRKQVKGIAIRSTFIAGFPSETEEDFNILLDFINKAKLTNAGFFAYSKEPDTPAYKLKGHLTKKVKDQRVKALYKAQSQIAFAFTNSMVGKKLTVVCDGVDMQKQLFYGRAYFNAPEVDGKIYLTYPDKAIEQGKAYKVKINNAKGYDLFGEILYELT